MHGGFGAYRRVQYAYKFGAYRWVQYAPIVQCVVKLVAWYRVVAKAWCVLLAAIRILIRCEMGSAFCTT